MYHIACTVHVHTCEDLQWKWVKVVMHKATNFQGFSVSRSLVWRFPLTVFSSFLHRTSSTPWRRHVHLSLCSHGDQHPTYHGGEATRWCSVSHTPLSRCLYHRKVSTNRMRPPVERDITEGRVWGVVWRWDIVCECQWNIQ